MLNRYILDLSLKFNDLRLYSCISQVSRPPMVELMQDNTYQALGLNSYGLLGDCLYLFDAYLYQCRFSCIQHGKLFLRESMCIMYYCDVIMGAMASQITSLTIVYSTVHSDANQRRHQSCASLAFVRGIHRWPVNSPHKWPVTRKMFTFDDVIMYMNLSQQAFCALTDTTFTDQIQPSIPNAKSRHQIDVGAVYHATNARYHTIGNNLRQVLFPWYLRSVRHFHELVIFCGRIAPNLREMMLGWMAHTLPNMVMISVIAC